MTNIAKKLLPRETEWKRPEDATNGIVNGYTATKGFAHAPFPISYTIDFAKHEEVVAVRFLLWDGLNGDAPTVNKPRDRRKYSYELYASRNGEDFTLYYRTLVGVNGWQYFEFHPSVGVKSVRIFFLHNTENDEVHLVEFEVHNTLPSSGRYEIVTSHMIQGPWEGSSDRLNTINELVSNRLDNLDSEIIALSNKLSGEFEARMRSSSSEASSIVDALKINASKGQELQTQMEDVIHKFQKATQQLEYVGRSLNFQQEADKNRTRSTYWLLASITSFVGLATLLTWFLFFDSHRYIDIAKGVETCLGKSSALVDRTLIFEFVSFLIAKILFISLMIFVLTFCIRNFRAQRHNYTVNQHRALSLASTSEFLSNDKLEKKTAEQVLLQGTSSIFAHQPSGYTDLDADNPNAIAQIADVTKKIKH